MRQLLRILWLRTGMNGNRSNDHMDRGYELGDGLRDSLKALQKAIREVLLHGKP